MGDATLFPRGARVLVIDDEPSIRRSLSRVLGERGFVVETAATAKDGLAAAESMDPHVILLDLRLPDATGLDVLRELRARDPLVAVLMITAYGDVSEAVQALHLGAADFLKKPYELEEVVVSVTAAARRATLETELARYRDREAQSHRREALIGECAAMIGVRSLIAKVARGAGTTVLVEGESGTGKELVARAIHQESERRDAPLLDLNCAAVQESMLENELFGHERGAYTDAKEMKRGLAELADGGTLFLDEVADMPVGVQSKLLRFLDSRSFRRLGGTRDINVDLRVITATNKALAEEARAGRFRSDLFYRLRVVTVLLPPLRDRGGDVDLLAEHFLTHYARRFHKRFRRLAPETRAVLRAYAWPGNVRELKNVMERAVLLEDGDELLAEHLPPEIAMLANTVDPVREVTAAPARARRGVPSLAEVTDQHIQRVLEMVHGNKSEAAAVLGISRRGLLYRLQAMQERLRTSP